MKTEWLYALVGGLIIGASVSILFVANGRVTGISGILNGVLVRSQREHGWRWSFLGGLLLGGFFLRWFMPEAFPALSLFGLKQIIIAGFLVGFGTVMGNGCTSGHGVCGMSRFSIRSIAATLTFMGAGIATVAVMRWLGVWS